MVGLLFVVPLYLQSVRGYTPLGTGLRLLPLILGLVIGAKGAERLTVRLGTRLPVVAGLLLITAGLSWGATLTVATPYAVMAGWMALTGVGLGATITPAMDAILGEIPPERSGSGTALTMALRQTGGALGVAVLGSVASATYISRLDLTDLSGSMAATVRESVTAGMAVAHRLGEPLLADSVAQAYVHALAVVLLGTAALATLTAAASAVFLPGPSASDHTAAESVTIPA
jgi:hypothetical protein